MGNEYSEIIMVGPFEIVKGFVIGYYLGAGNTDSVFFHVKSGKIRHDTLLGSIKTLLDFENKIPFCMENSMINDFVKAVKLARPRTGIFIKEIKKIISAEFQFNYVIYNQKLGEACKKVFKEVPEGIKLLDYEPEEEKHEEYSTMTFKGTARSYRYSGSGTVQGEFDPAVHFFFAIKQSECSEFIECHDVKLNLEGENEE